MEERFNFKAGQIVVCVSDDFPPVYDTAVGFSGVIAFPAEPKPLPKPAVGERLPVADVLADDKYGLWLNFQKYNLPDQKRWFHFSRFRKNITLETALAGAEVCRKQFPGFYEFGTVFFVKGEPLPFIAGLNTTGRADSEVITEAYYELMPWDKPRINSVVYHAGDFCNDYDAEEEQGGAATD